MEKWKNEIIFSNGNSFLPNEIMVLFFLWE